MKRSVIQQRMVLAFVALSLTANIPDAREQAAGRRVGAERQLGVQPRIGVKSQARGLARRTEQAGPASYARGGPGCCEIAGLPCRATVAPPAVFPVPPAWICMPGWLFDGSGGHSNGRPCPRWDVAPSVNPGDADGADDPLVAVLHARRYCLPSVLQECAWSHPIGLGEPARPAGFAGQSGRANMDVLIPRLKAIFSRAGVPPQWVWLAEVESGLNPQAVSPAGAAGMFQLMPDTARRFGLQTAPWDDRMDPEKSAAAAAQYLSFLHREFGCWSLALAAYNAGEGRVRGIMQKHQARTFAELARYLPSETRAYVPKVMTIAALREDRIRGVPGAYWMP